MATSGAAFKGLLQLPALYTGSGHSASTARNAAAEVDEAEIAAKLKLYDMQQNFQQQQALTATEYENILKHINSYVQQLVEIKMQKQQAHEKQQQQQLSPQMTLIIANVVRENLERVVRDKRDAKLETSLSGEEIQRIASLVRAQLEADGSATVQPLRHEHISQIRLVLSEQLAQHKPLEQIDLDAFLKRLLLSPALSKFVDDKLALWQQTHPPTEGSGGSEIGIDLQQQRQQINELNNEIAFVKLTLSEKLSENQDLHMSISQLQRTQHELQQRMQTHELSTDARFTSLLAEIDAKLATLQDGRFTLLNQQIKLSLVEMLGFKHAAGNDKLEDIDLQHWVRNMFVAKELLEQRLSEINTLTNEKIQAELDRSGVVLMRDISERLKREILVAVESKQQESNAALRGQISAALSEQEVRQIVKSVLAIYDADKTGLVDFALESAGGQILSTRCTESYQTKTAQLSVFGIPLWYPTNTPRVAISPNVQPGECWAFQGFPGFLVLKLNSLVYVTGFTLEHIPRSLAPNGQIDSAPRNFTVWGLEHEKDQDPVLFGEYEYVDNDASLQYFPLQNKNIRRPYEIVELRIESNHGQPLYTCLYRFRVHGKPPAA